MDHTNHIRAFGSSGSILGRLGCNLQALALVFLVMSLVMASRASAQILDGGDFEQGLDEWFAIGPVQLGVSQDSPEDGCCACVVSQRTSEWNGVGQNITGELIPGRTYAVSGWAKLIGADEDVLTLKMRQIDEAGTRWIQLARGFARSDRWRRWAPIVPW